MPQDLVEIQVEQPQKEDDYQGKIHDVQINIVQQRISKTKNYGGKRGGGGGERKKEEKKRKKSVFLVKSLVWQRKN